MRLRTHAIVLGLFLVLLALYTYPLILNPGDLFPSHHDPRLWSWVMASNGHRFLESPLTLFHGNALYPYGSTVTFSEPLLVPTLFFAPILGGTGNPVLAYNLTLLVFWALSGWAMYRLAFSLTHSHPASLLAAAAFTLCPYRIDYYLEFQMQLLFGVPLALLGWYRYLVRQQWSALFFAFSMLYLTTLSSIYYGIILTLAMACFAVVFLLLRWKGWRRIALVQLTAGGALFSVLLLPIAWPYLRTSQQLGFRRSLEQPFWASADILTYVETRSTALYQLNMDTAAETTLFMGFVVVALSLTSLLWLRNGPRSPWPRLEWCRRFAWRALVITALACGSVLVSLGVQPSLREVLSTWQIVSPLLMCLAVIGLVVLSVEGWVRGATDHASREFTERDWVMALLFLGYVFFLLSLGPVIRVGGEPVGTGLHQYLYAYLPIFTGVRVMTRFGVIPVFALSLLAALGAAWLFRRVSHAVPRTALAVILPTVLLVEYWAAPLQYAEVGWPGSESVYQALSREREDFAILEYPLYADKPDATYMFNSSYHWAYLINGVSGFTPPLTRELAGVLRDDKKGFPSPRAREILHSIYPLRYIIVHNSRIRDADRSRWTELKVNPDTNIRFVESYGTDDLFEVNRPVDRGLTIEKTFSYDYVQTHDRATFRLRWRGNASGVQHAWADVLYNGRHIFTVDLSRQWQERLSLDLAGLHRRADRNRLTFQLGYELAPEVRADEAYSLGETAPRLPVDLFVRSAAKPVGGASSVLVNGREYSTDQRGYNLVAIEPTRGRVLAAVNFNTSLDKTASTRMKQFIDGLAEGTILVAAVRDDASGELGVDAIAALRTVGSQLDLRGRPYSSHVLVGVKRALPLPAIEQMSRRAVRLRIGRRANRVRLELRAFAMGSGRPAR